jgi:hypothetical protein
LNTAGIALVQAWVNNVVPNYGFILQDYVVTNGLDFSSRETSTAANRPRLTITYVAGDPPQVTNDTLTVPQDTPGSVNVLANDSDPEGGALTIVNFTLPAHGTLSLSGGTFTYTPDTGYAGSDSFSYTVADNAGLTATASVSIEVTASTLSPSSVDPFFSLLGEDPDNPLLFDEGF